MTDRTDQATALEFTQLLLEEFGHLIGEPKTWRERERESERERETETEIERRRWRW